MAKSLYNWAVIGNPWAAPEIRTFVLYGYLEPGEDRSKRLRTSLVAEVIDDRTVRTKSGTIYTLVGPSSSNDKDDPLKEYPQDDEDPLGDVRMCLEVQKKN